MFFRNKNIRNAAWEKACKKVLCSGKRYYFHSSWWKLFFQFLWHLKVCLKLNSLIERRWVIKEKRAQKENCWIKCRKFSSLVRLLKTQILEPLNYLRQLNQKQNSSVRQVLQKQMREIIGSLTFNINSIFCLSFFVPVFLLFNLGNLTLAVLPLMNVICFGLNTDWNKKREVIPSLMDHDKCSVFTILPIRSLLTKIFHCLFIYFTLFTGHQVPLPPLPKRSR